MNINKMIMRLAYLDWRVFWVSNNSDNSVTAGSLAVNVNNTWSNANVNTGSQLCLFKKYFVKIFEYADLASWQKIKKSLIQVSRFNLENLEVK